MRKIAAPDRYRQQATVDGCSCEWAASATFHDELVGFETRGVAGVVWLLDVLGAHADEEPGDDHPLAWTELVRCVAEHNWRDPVSVSRLAVELHGLFRHRHAATVVAAVTGPIPPWAIGAGAGLDGEQA